MLKLLNSWILFSVSFGVGFGACASIFTPNEHAEVFPATVIDGSAFRVTFDTNEGATQASVEFLEQTAPCKSVPVLETEKNSVRKHWVAFLGVPLDTPPKKYPVKIKYSLDGKSIEHEIKIEVQPGNYPSETLHVNPAMLKPPKKFRKRIRKENEELREMYSLISLEQFWQGKFVWPLQSPVTSGYGTHRTYNGETTGYHQGIDLRATVGTPIRASGGGKVAMAKNLYFTGNTVILDHGFGVMTIYAHMDRLKVKKGQTVKLGQLIGLAGKTGRANGPHLHWGASVQRVKVNPQDLLKVME